MKRIILSILATICLLFTTTAFADTSTDNTAAQTVVENFFAAMKAGDADKAGTYLAPNFVSVHTDGMVRNKAQEITLIKGLHMKNYKLSSFQFSSDGDAMVVTFIDKGAEMIDSKPIATKPSLRMAVLHKQGDQWTIFAYANLDTIGRK